ncbi:hypothetical protein TRFO_31363 [Tritrichomonas foetus]|uniref:Uncharacterized protein n=1 Tax=Tritrichomonas foetus TaxID=1144522 RepID=A0A1J4JW10_9EUKA|nr:hypothetical protein TRFO_31363 [Tritrichomonas foetus]|eukprot:OHT01708.1 hypothetical protein TRFO_31363 [Tritrichomonas foetus]
MFKNEIPLDDKPKSKSIDRFNEAILKKQQSIQEMQEKINSLKKELMQAQFELRKKNRENAEHRLLKEGDLSEKIQMQSKFIEELKNKFDEVDQARLEESQKQQKIIDNLNGQIQALTEERNNLLIENQQQKAIIEELRSQLLAQNEKFNDFLISTAQKSDKISSDNFNIQIHQNDADVKNAEKLNENEIKTEKKSNDFMSDQISIENIHEKNIKLGTQSYPKESKSEIIKQLISIVSQMKRNYTEIKKQSEQLDA